jgi:O-antigen/teichoic acid export membrane protein
MSEAALTPEREPLRPITTGAVMGAASRILATVAGGLATIVLARSLGPGDFGSYSVAVSLVVILTVLTTLGVEHGIAYYVGNGGWDAHAAHVTALKVSAVMGVAGAGLGMIMRLAYPSAFDGLSVGLVALALTALPFALAFIYATYLFLATDRYEPFTLLPAGQAILTFALAASGAVLFGLTGAVVGLTLATISSGLASSAWAVARLPRGGPNSPGELRRAIAFGIKGYAGNALQLLNYRLDLFILAATASAVAVGRYSTAVAATTLLWVLPGALSAVLFPRVARLSGQGDHEFLEMVETKALRHVSLITGTSALVLAVALELLLVPVFGQAYQPAVDLGLILIPGCAAIALASVLASAVVGRGRPGYSLYVSLVTTPFTLGLYALLIPWLGATGAALASTLSYLCNFGLFCHFYRKLTARRVLPLLLPTGAEVDDLRVLLRRARTRTRAHFR